MEQKPKPKRYECKIADNDWVPCRIVGRRFSAGFAETKVYVPSWKQSFIVVGRQLRERS